MAASKLSSYVAMAIAAATLPSLSARAYADSGGFHFSPFSSSSSSSSDPKDPSPSGKSEPEPEEPRGSGMDPEALERAAKALREINSSKSSKQVSFSVCFIWFDLIFFFFEIGEDFIFGTKMMNCMFIYAKCVMGLEMNAWRC